MIKKSTIRNLVTAIVVAILIFAAFWYINDYKRGGMEGPLRSENPQRCVNYYEECHCFGIVVELESYPAQYKCKGHEVCKDINETVCK